MTQKELISIPLGKIFADEEFNCRGQIKMTDVVDLAKSIQDQGLIQPVSVMPMNEEAWKNANEQAITEKQKLEAKDYEYYLLAGFRRFLAHRVNESDTIDAIVVEKELTHGEQIAFNLSENLSRKQLNVLQEAKTLEKLYLQGCTEAEVCELTNQTRGWVQIRTMLLKLPPPIQESAALGEIAQNDIRRIYTEFRNVGADESIRFAKRIKEGRKTGRVVKGKAEKNRKKIRNKGEMVQMLEHLADTDIPFGLHNRTLAWAAGEINDDELHESLQEEAERLGVSYERPVD